MRTDIKIKFGDVATYINGYAFNPAQWDDTGLPIIRIQDLTGNAYQTNYYNGDYEKKYEVNKGDVLISWSASIGIYEWNSAKALLNQHIFKVFFDKQKVVKKFFIYQAETILKKFSNATHGATMKHFTKKVFDNLPFSLPAITEQQRIANELDKVSELIDKRQTQLQKLDLLIKSKFVEMFDNNKYQYISVGSITEIKSGGTPNRDKNEYWNNGKIPWIKTTELKNNLICYSEEYITEEGLKNSSAKLVPPNTILIAMYGQGKTRGMTGWLRMQATTNQACACILPNKQINQKYLWEFLKLNYDKLRNMAKGGNQPNLNLQQIKDFEVLSPPIELQNQFADFVDKVEQSKTQIKASLDKLITLKKALMQKYFD